jgi:hypothetical protein
MEDDMVGTLRFAHALGLAAACAGFNLVTPVALRAQSTTEVKQQSTQFTKTDVAAQLGAKLATSEAEDFSVGGTITATLTDPSRLAALGLTGLHEGARVTAMRISPVKVRVEVDELEPVPLTKKATFKLDERGRLSVATP